MGPGPFVPYPAAPNPSNPLTSVHFRLDRPGRTRLEILDLAGRRVRRLVDEDLAAGDHRGVWDGRDDRRREVGSGVYLVRAESGGAVAVRTIVLVR